MSQFATLMRTVGMPAFERVLGDAATYTPPYTPPAEPAPVTTWAIVRTRSDLVGQYGERLEPRLTAKLPRADVSTPIVGATLTVGAVTYSIDQQLAITDWFVTLAIRDGTGINSYPHAATGGLVAAGTAGAEVAT